VDDKTEPMGQDRLQGLEHLPHRRLTPVRHRRDDVEAVGAKPAASRQPILPNRPNARP